MITINELFSGIGAQVVALKRLGINYKVVGISEIDTAAIQSYERMNGCVRNYGDISKIEKLDYADLWTYSFPCQDLSVAGKKSGISEGTRSGLLLEVERLLEVAMKEKTLPKFLLLENVKNLVGKKFKPDFDRWLNKLSELGYNNYWKVLNAKDYGVPQNRERVFVVSIRKDLNQTYMFPEKKELKLRLKDLLESEVDEKYYLSQEKVEQLTLNLNKDISNTIRCGGGGGSLDGRHTWDLVVGSTQKNAYKGYTNSVSPCLTEAMGMGGGQIPMIVNGGAGDIDQKHTQNLVAEPSIVQNPHGYNNGGIIKDNVAATMTSNGSYHLNNFVCNEPLIAASCGRNPDNPSSREIGLPTVQRIEINKSGCSNTLTTVGKDNLVVEPNVLTPKRTECNQGVLEIGNIFDTDSFGGNPQVGRVYNTKGLSPCLDTMGGGNRQPKILENGIRIRKLTPKECWRLMGFTDEEFDKARGKFLRIENKPVFKVGSDGLNHKVGITPTEIYEQSNTQLYKQAGNSIVVDVLVAIFKNLNLEEIDV